MTLINNAPKWIFLLVAISLLTRLQNRVNCKRENRARQVLLPAVALLFDIVGVVVLSVNITRIQKLISWVGRILVDDAGLGNGIRTAFGGGLVPIANLLLMAAFIIIKCIACPIVARIWRNDDLVRITSSYFYEYDEGEHRWVFARRWINLRRILKAFVFCGVAVSAVLLGYLWINAPAPAQPLWFPCAALIVMTEAWSFLNGLTKEEIHHEVEAEEADSRRVGNFYRVREIYEKIFAPQVLASHTGCEFSAHEGPSAYLQTLSASQDPIDQQVAQHFSNYENSVELEIDHMQATRDLMRGKSVVLFDPFYRDLENYLVLPVTDTLLRGKKCLVVAGRDSISRDAANWMEGLLQTYSGLRYLWKVQMASRRVPDSDVVVLDFPQLYDVDLLRANREFFSETGFVLLLEPSVMMSTGQIGLSIIAKEMERYGTAPTYCVCDHSVDGLVDTISHVLHTEITDVVAPPAPRCIYTGMGWNADGDFLRQRLFGKETRYLGNGLELAAVAVKNQVPKVTWCGENKTPLRDVQWIAGQHYGSICRYMNLPVQQKNLYDRVEFVPILWSTTKAREQFMIVEDEFCNLFGMMRTFLSRGVDQTFVNVLSENYLLRDYMRCNPQMLRANPNAIPTMAPGYAKTERNTLYKLIIGMAFRPIAEEDIREELLIAGCPCEDVFSELSRLLERYTFADGSILELKSVDEDEGTLSSHMVNYYSISAPAFEQYFASSLKNAYYVSEEEKQDAEFINAKMFGHVPQTILPGQMVVYDGKYYMVKAISPQAGVVLCRAADLYTGRRYYRQLRTYRLESIADQEPSYVRKMLGMEVAIYPCDFSVTTQGYIELPDEHDLRRGREVRFDADPMARVLDRSFRNKSVIALKLPDTDDDVRFTICMLLGELFHSVFPESWPYIAVLTKQPEDIQGIMRNMVYTLEGDIPEDMVYIVEDSELDLGLVEAISRSLPQFLEILCDYLEWHMEKMREAPKADPVLKSAVEIPEDPKRRNLFLRLADRVRRLIGGSEKEVKVKTVEQAEREAPKAQTETKPTLQPVPDAREEVDYSPADTQVEPEVRRVDGLDGTGTEEGDYALDEAGRVDSSAVESQRPSVQPTEQEQSHPEDELEPDADADLVHIDGTDIFDDTDHTADNLWLEDRFAEMGITPIQKSRYQKECFLKFGFEEIDRRLKLDEVHKYLRVRGCGDSALTKARKREGIAENEMEASAINHCDFCAVPLSGVSYEVLNDGRVRCNDCSASAITTAEDFEGLFKRILTMMEGFYGVTYQTSIHVKMADARKVARGAGAIFKPNAGVASRVLGYAQRKGKKYSLLVENGSPRLAAVDTMVHEMTHIWQYLNWKDQDIRKRYGRGVKRLIVYEGMACWAAIQFLYAMGESYYAQRAEMLMNQRDDPYGIGFRLYCERYPLVKDMSLIKYSPFSVYPPL